MVTKKGNKKVIKREVGVSDALTAHHRLSSMSWQLGSELCILSPSLRMRYSSVTPNWTKQRGVHVSHCCVFTMFWSKKGHLATTENHWYGGMFGSSARSVTTNIPAGFPQNAIEELDMN